MSVCVFANCPNPSPGPDGRCFGCASLTKDSLIRERYLVEEVKTRTKFGVSYLAFDTKHNNAPRIVKELQPVSEDNPDFYSPTRSTAERLFEREARVLMTLQHPGIPRLFSTFVESEYCYIVQEFIPGTSLISQLESSNGIINEFQARQLLSELAHILIYLHSRTPPVVHRDIKPQNLMRAEQDGRLLLTDFAAVSQNVRAQQYSGTVIGTAGYAPPEQLSGRSVPQSDLYAAGATIIRLMTGVHPSKLYRPMERRYVWEDRTTVTPSFSEVINGLLEPDLGARTSSAEVVLEELEILRPLREL